MKIKFDKDYKEISDSDKERVVNTATIAFTIFESQELVPTAFFGNSEEGTITVAGLSFGNDFEKELIVHKLKQAIKASNSDSVMIVMESYILPTEYAEDFQKNRHKYRAVADHPQRLDGVVMTYENKKGTWMANVIVDCENRTVVDKEVVFTKCEVGGLFSGFIEKDDRNLN